MDTNNSSPVSQPLTNKYPEGKVWVVNGNLDLGETTFYGKGTIIVNGTVNIKGNIKYGTSTNGSFTSLGIIAKGGNINISNDVKELHGAFYSYYPSNDTLGEIKIE